MARSWQVLLGHRGSRRQMSAQTLAGHRKLAGCVGHRTIEIGLRLGLVAELAQASRER